jgi:hypothetical protein
MLNNLDEQARGWQEQAVYCAQQADARSDPKVKRQFLELRRLWLLLARSYETNPKSDNLPSPTRR